MDIQIIEIQVVDIILVVVVLPVDATEIIQDTEVANLIVEVLDVDTIILVDFFGKLK